MKIVGPNTADERVEAVYFTRDSLVVDLMDGRTISAPLNWYPKLLKAIPKERSHWEICRGGYGIHWPEIDEDLSTEGLLRGSPAPRTSKLRMTNKSKTKTVNQTISFCKEALEGKVFFHPIEGSGSLTISWTRAPKGDALEAKKGSGVGFFSDSGELLCVIFDEVLSSQDRQFLEFNHYRVEIDVKNGKVKYSVTEKNSKPLTRKKRIK